MKPGEPFNPWRRLIGLVIPAGVASSTLLSPAAKLAYGHLLRRAGEDGHCFPSYDDVARALGLERRQAMRLLRELETAGLISTEKRAAADGRQTSNGYKFLWHEMLDCGPGEGVKSVTERVSEMSPTRVSEMSPEVRNKNREILNPQTPAAKTAAGSAHIFKIASNGNQTKLSHEAEDAFGIAAETFDPSDEEREEALNREPVPKHSLLNPEVETVLDQVARRIYGRHPTIRRCGLGEVKKQLRAIARKATAAKRTEVLHQIDRNHAGWCARAEWRKDDGQYAKGLDNWLAPTKERWNEPPPTPPCGSELPNAEDYLRERGMI